MADVEVPKLEEFVVMPDGKNTAGKALIRLARVGDKSQRVIALVKDKSTRLVRVGHVYEIPTISEGKTFMVGKIRWLREYENTAVAEGWQAQQRAADSFAAAKAVEKRESSPTSALEPHFKALRNAYHSVPPSQRVAFEVYLLHQVRKYPQ